MSLFIRFFYLGFRREHTYQVDNSSGLLQLITEDFVEKLINKKTHNIKAFDSRIIFGELRLGNKMFLYGGELLLEAKNNSISSKYSIKLNPIYTIAILIVSILLIIQLWEYDVIASLFGILITAFLLFLSLYFQVFLFDGLVTSSVRKVTDLHPFIEISSEQKEWMINENKCPACGSYVNRSDTICSSCGLSLI
mgnify:CR=1 FL=1